MDIQFRYLEPGVHAEWPEVARTVYARGKAEDASVRNAVDMAYDAADLFRGCIDPEGDALFLPWSDEYFKPAVDGNGMTEMPIRVEVEKVISILLSDERGLASGRWDVSTYYFDELNRSEKTRVQGLAVEAMLCADIYLHFLRKRNLSKATAWLSAGHKKLAKCMRHAYSNLASAT